MEELWAEELVGEGKGWQHCSRLAARHEGHMKLGGYNRWEGRGRRVQICGDVTMECSRKGKTRAGNT